MNKWDKTYSSCYMPQQPLNDDEYIVNINENTKSDMEIDNNDMMEVDDIKTDDDCDQIFNQIENVLQNRNKQRI